MSCAPYLQCGCACEFLCLSTTSWSFFRSGRTEACFVIEHCKHAEEGISSIAICEPLRMLPADAMHQVIFKSNVMRLAAACSA